MLELGQPAIKEEVRAVLTQLLNRPAFFLVTSQPEPSFGFDNDSAMDLGNGSLYLKTSGAWNKVGEVWLDDLSRLPALQASVEPQDVEPEVQQEVQQEVQGDL